MIIDQIVIDDKTHNYTQTSGGSIQLLGTYSEEEAARIKQKIRTQISTKRRPKGARIFLHIDEIYAAFGLSMEEA